MDHQSIGLIARSIEEAGLPTLYLGSCRDMMARVRAPRSAFLNFPLGHQCGKPDDKELQTRILKDALEVLVIAQDPGTLVDLGYEWDIPFDWETYQRDINEMLEEEGQAYQDWKPNK